MSCRTCCFHVLWCNFVFSMFGAIYCEECFIITVQYYCVKTYYNIVQVFRCFENICRTTKYFIFKGVFTTKHNKSTLQFPKLSKAFIHSTVPASQQSTIQACCLEIEESVEEELRYPVQKRILIISNNSLQTMFCWSECLKV